MVVNTGGCYQDILGELLSKDNCTQGLSRSHIDWFKVTDRITRLICAQGAKMKE
jgi:hypothetical protein